jgi:hypothetical protein
MISNIGMKSKSSSISAAEISYARRSVSVATLIFCLLITALVGGAVGGYISINPSAIQAAQSTSTPAQEADAAATSAIADCQRAVHLRRWRQTAPIRKLRSADGGPVYSGIDVSVPKRIISAAARPRREAAAASS